VKASLLAQAAQVGQLAFLHVPLSQARVETVESQEDQPLDLGMLVSLPPGNRPPQNANRPEQNADESEKHSTENADERAKKSEAGAWTDICQVPGETEGSSNLAFQERNLENLLVHDRPVSEKA
jgi:hypothetical protein